MIENILGSDAGPQSVEFLKSAVPGYTNYQELQWLKKYGLPFKPELVGVVFVMNDLFRFLHNIEMPGGGFPTIESLTFQAHRPARHPVFAAMAAEPDPAAPKQDAPELGHSSHVRSRLPYLVQWPGQRSRLIQFLNRHVDVVGRTVRWWETGGFIFDYRGDLDTAWQDEPWETIESQTAELVELGAKHGYWLFR